MGRKFHGFPRPDFSRVFEGQEKSYNYPFICFREERPSFLSHPSFLNMIYNAEEFVLIKGVHRVLWEEYIYLRDEFWGRLKTLSMFSYYMYKMDYRSAWDILKKAGVKLQEHVVFYCDESPIEKAMHLETTSLLEYKHLSRDVKCGHLAHSVFRTGLYPDYHEFPPISGYNGPKPYQTWEHHISGTYTIICNAVEERTLNPLIICVSHQTNLPWACRIEDWTDEVDVGGVMKKRFIQVDPK